MSILSKIKSVAKNYAKNVIGGAKIVQGGVKRLASSGIKSIDSVVDKSLAASITANKDLINKQTQAFQEVIDKPKKTTLTNEEKQRVLNSNSTIGPKGTQSTVIAPIAPTTLAAGQRTPNSALPAPIYNAPADYTPSTTSTISPESQTSESITSSSLSASAPSVSLPSAPSNSNPGTVNNGGLVGDWTKSGYNYDANTNMATPIPETVVDPAKQTEEQRRLSVFQKLQEMIPQKEQIQDDPAIKKQQKELEKRKSEVNTYTSQLNSVVAKQNADLLTLRGVGSTEGVTEAVYGGQQAAINREAAIKALPIQAQLSAAQGNVELAQNYLTQLTTFRTEKVNNDYNYKTALFNSISEFTKGEDKIRLEDKRKQEERAYDEKKANIALLDSITKDQLKENPTLISQLSNLNTSSPNFREELGRIAGIKSSSTPGTYTEKQTKAITKLNEDVSKNATYAKTTSMRNYADNVTASLSQTTGVGDIAAINQFQKVIDEGAVTRDQDVQLIQSSQSLANSLKTRIKKLEKGQQLSPELRKEMRTAVESLYDAQVKALQKDPYIKAKTKEAELYGLTLSDTIIGELGNFTREDATQSLTPDERGKVDQMRKDGIPDSVIQEVFGKPLSFNSVGGDTNKASKIAQAIKTVESGGNYNAKGASGENGAYQFMPSTWKDWSVKYLGNPNAPMTKQNQDKVALAKINDLIDQGYDEKEIALIWNGGSPKVKKGVNSKGVAYDSGAYANKILKTLNS